MDVHTFFVRKAIGTLVVFAAVGLVAFYWYASKGGEMAQGEMVGSDPKNTAYVIDGELVQLTDGFAKTRLEDGADRETLYFGNELKTDLNGDGTEDVAFMLTQTDGVYTYFYAVAALNTPEGYVGSDGYFLGTNIAPQSTTLSPNPRHVRVVVFNYADREPGEAVGVPPSVGQSAYVKIDEDNRWAVVLPDFEGESDI